MDHEGSKRYLLPRVLSPLRHDETVHPVMAMNVYVWDNSLIKSSLRYGILAVRDATPYTPMLMYVFRERKPLVNERMKTMNTLYNVHSEDLTVWINSSS